MYVIIGLIMGWETSSPYRPLTEGTVTYIIQQETVKTTLLEVDRLREQQTLKWKSYQWSDLQI
jgi:hypothetical protein